MKIQPLLGITACLLLAACGSSNRTLPFFDLHGKPQQLSFRVAGDGTPLATVSSENKQGDRTFQLQTLSERKILLALNQQDYPLQQPLPHKIERVEFYELGQAGFVDVYQIQATDVCHAFRHHKPLNAEHALTFYQRDPQGQLRMSGLISQFEFSDNALLHINTSELIPPVSQPNQFDGDALLHGSYQKIRSFLAHLICH
ncbi:hypothetical protein [Testudinibacter aquarius]|uniref:Lipoprotein n=1 Tax=Testudinibacter aquarius TaxID=1524974 RepID=A0A4R3XUM8_9PAST|nr:hypothetical protein [Testudinibacter aquarius]KAE9527197.1 hypothetical protein A1D24_11780 [Testudinibacter aquarius]TCV82946.1 hypothetical protein EDC16_11815 [Testudinibacter aquarius]TNG91519.1 hypothetical protein FHQ21_07410 [Testudinibacter aquarius]